jgi:2-oxoisovalerate dehydrogenase E2 component (dihydrolipoyl transacylase)
MPKTVVKMPQLGESVAEGTIGRWLKQPGDRVERDEPLVEIQTDKVNAEVPSPVAGILQEILLPEGATAAVKTDMAVIGDEDETSPPPPPAPSGEAQPPQVPDQRGGSGQREAAEVSTPSLPRFVYDTSPGGAGPTSSARAGAEESTETKRFYTPVVMRMAQEHGIDLSTIQGTGTNGRVTRRDVERALAQRPSAPPAPAAPAVLGPTIAVAGPPSAAPGWAPIAAPAAPTVAPIPPTAMPSPPMAPAAAGPPRAAPAGPSEDRPLTPMRRAIAEHMSRARAEIPDAWALVEIDATHLARQRDALQAEWQPREGFELTYLPFFVKAVLAGLRAVPELNASWAGDHIVIHRQYHLGIAVSVENGLVVPVLRDADQLSVAGLARQLRQIIQKARSGKLTLDDLQGATFHVNNPGALGSIMSQPIVPVGAAGIVTMEAVVKRPVVTADDAIAIRSIMNCCLSFDHRILDGAQALRFLRTVKEQIESVDYPLW